jgi:threonine dehydrogenase-like Zn-dependent dehydrogenase
MGGAVWRVRTSFGWTLRLAAHKRYDDRLRRIRISVSVRVAMTIQAKGPQSTQQDAATARALWTIAPRFCEMRSEPLGTPGPAEARVRMLVSGISGGTESLVFAGKVPASEFERMRAPFQAGEFPFPVKYGYAAVGIVEDGPVDWFGVRVFVLHPHQDRFVVPVASLTRIADEVPSTRAVLSANLETALNAVWDAGVAPGERVAIIGAGVVGSLVAAIVSRIPGVELTLFDTDAARRGRADQFGGTFVHLPTGPERAQRCPEALLPEPVAGDFDCVFHTSGHGAGLVTALEIAGTEGRIIELSWYGNATVTLPLGQAFHSRRLSLVASQVGAIAPSRRARFDHRRRMAVVQRLLADERLDALLGTRVDFEDLPRTFGTLLTHRAGLCPVVVYPS